MILNLCFLTVICCTHTFHCVFLTFCMLWFLKYIKIDHFFKDMDIVDSIVIHTMGINMTQKRCFVKTVKAYTKCPFEERVRSSDHWFLPA